MKNTQNNYQKQLVGVHLVLDFEFLNETKQQLE